MAKSKASTDLFVNIAILVTCAIMSIGVIRQITLRPGKSQVPKMALFEEGRAAESLSGVVYQASKATVVLYVKSTCRYCTGSMPFYAVLAQHVARREGVRLAVASNEEINVAKSYLAAHQLSVSEVVRSQLARVPTPTIVIVDRSGKVQRTWVGQQQDSGEREILKFIDAL